MPREFEDIELTVVLNEYELVREQRCNNRNGSNARFNYFLVVASGGTAIVAGMLGTPGGSTMARIAAAGALGAVVLALGLSVFVRLVYYRISDVEHAYTLNALRTYLLRRAPSVRSYVLLPTLDDDDASLPHAMATRAGTARSWAGLAQTVGLVNSVLLGLAAATTAHFAHLVWWGAVPVGVAVAAVSVLLHRRYEQRAVALATLAVDHRARQRVRTQVIPRPWPSPWEEPGMELALRDLEYS